MFSVKKIKSDMIEIKEVSMVTKPKTDKERTKYNKIIITSISQNKCLMFLEKVYYPGRSKTSFPSTLMTNPSV